MTSYYKKLSSLAGTNAIGIHTIEGIILVIEKGVDTLLDIPCNSHEVWEIDKQLMCVVSGPNNQIPDINRFIHFIREKTDSVLDLVKYISEYIKINTQHLSIIMASKNSTGTLGLWHINRGASFRLICYTAIGPKEKEAKAYMMKHYKLNLNFKNGMKLAFRTMIHIIGWEKFKSFNIDFARITNTGNVYINTYADNERYIREFMGA
ncbi:uncharacterized protein LOC119671776 [Teleopsis dalmanni]|uniref:uncharacterized protein LOC119671776 n=1 Tax=Teleopsis dalmanni TaxID=139649 RepID=UPI0018CF4C5E|nr:uncharacterized protein LOC119671776 [Teleopsis dalmanni]